MRRLLAKGLLRLIGWRPLGAPPTVDRCVLIAAPHTSNWDLPVMLLFRWYFAVEVNWLGKHTLFDGPFGWLFRWLGGLPVDRRAPHGVVGAAARHLREAESLILAISPEGTRSRTEHWKSGFYHIARTAEVPVVCGVLDFGRKEGGFGPTLYLTGDVETDMRRIRSFYADRSGYRPELFGPVQLTAETTAAPEPAAAAAG